MNGQTEETVNRETKRKIPVRLIVIIAAVLIFAVGMAVEVYKHSDSRMKSLLEDNRAAFESCARFFGEGGGADFRPDDADNDSAKDDADLDGTAKEPKRSTYASAEFLAEKYKDFPVSADITALGDAGVQKITLSGHEVRFYTDVNSGLCYISPEAQSSSGSYYPEGYLDENRIDGDWYRFGADVKKSKDKG